MKVALGFGLLVSCLLVAGGASAATVQFAGNLDPASEVTPPVTDGHAPNGGAVFSYDEATKTLCGRIEFDDLTGVPTGVHVHQAPKGMPAADGSATDKVVIPITTSPVLFKVILNASWETSLMTGEIYTNVHTAQNAKGEVRGTMDPFPEGAPVECPPGAALPLGVQPDAGAPDSGATSSTSSTGGTSSSSGAGTTSTSSGTTNKPIENPETPAKADSGCNSSASGPANTVSLALLAGVAIIAARGRLRRKKA